MRTIVKGKNLDVTEADRAYAERKLGRLERILDERSDARVELSIERHKRDEDSHIVEVSLVVDGKPLHSAARAATHRAAVDEVVDKLERQTVDLKQRPRFRSRAVAEKQILRSLADGTAGAPDEARHIVKVKRFALEPMFEEDAVSRMEELGHDFFVFVNAEKERLAVLYRRRDGDYGLIEPIVGGQYTQSRDSRRDRPRAGQG